MITTSPGSSLCTTPADASLAAQLFERWASLDTTATAGTSFSDWDTCAYRDAICFTRPGAVGADVYLLRDTSVITFGFEDDTLESAYQLLETPAPVAKSHTHRRLVRALSEKTT